MLFRAGNVIIGSCNEYTESSLEPRMLGLAMVPGKHIDKIWIDLSSLRPNSPSQSTPVEDSWLICFLICREYQRISENIREYHVEIINKAEAGPSEADNTTISNVLSCSQPGPCYIQTSDTVQNTSSQTLHHSGPKHSGKDWDSQNVPPIYL